MVLVIVLMFSLLVIGMSGEDLIRDTQDIYQLEFPAPMEKHALVINHAVDCFNLIITCLWGMLL